MTGQMNTIVSYFSQTSPNLRLKKGIDYGAHYKISPLHTPIPEHEREVRKTAWNNANTYAARLASTGDSTLTLEEHALDMAGYTIVDALELDFGEKEPEDLEAAAQLFIHAAPELYRRSEDRYTALDGRSDLPNRGTYERWKEINLWHGPEAYSLERWEFWRQRWTLLGGKKGFSEAARAAAQGALDAMNEAEKEAP